MKKVFKALQEVWDAAPKEIQNRDDYVFLISWDWKGAPTQFHKKPVHRERLLNPRMIMYLSSPYVDGINKNLFYDENTDKEM